MGNKKKHKFAVTDEIILENFKDLKEMIKESSGNQLQLSQVLQQMEKNVIHLTGIVNDIGGRE